MERKKPDRRQAAKVVMMYRIVNNLVDIDSRSVLIPAGVHTRGHANRFIVPFTTVNAYQYSFFPTGIRLWNGLPEQVVNSRLSSLAPLAVRR
ncbi:hypothetical protein DPMN_123160 [Dreissena polymorpha]|uniref:Uncharacterized protein n=1 Tax=Dreissena polymorpha TaxID=45954 RepID=A0A9D4GTX5_DREPO|nr:hypothetical protein DPMN_123160 [Dreissena polymorpha]